MSVAVVNCIYSGENGAVPDKQVRIPEGLYNAISRRSEERGRTIIKTITLILERGLAMQLDEGVDELRSSALTKPRRR